MPEQAPSEELLAPFRDLRARKGQQREDFIVEGVLAVERLLDSAYEPLSLVCTPSQRERLAPALAGVRCPVIEMPRKAIAELAGFDFHRGVLACARRPALRTELDPPELEALRMRERATIVVAEALADPRNLGALVRNAAAFGVDLLIADARGADLLSRMAIRASVGNVFRLPTLVSPNVAASVARLRHELGARIVAATPEPSAVALRAFEAPAKQVLLVGNEGEGLSSELLALADARVKIPVAAASDSLNVAAATAVLLYELTRA